MVKTFLRHLLVVLVVLSFAASALATTFIVPSDTELVQQSEGIVTGVIVSAEVVEGEKGYIETLYGVALDRVLKGPFEPRTVIRINSPGGAIDGHFSIVHSAAHFQIGDEVLLFLIPHRGGWTPTGLTLGKFRFAVTSKGYSVAIRDEEDIVGWDRDGKAHKETIRLEPEFISFIEETVAGRKPEVSYEIEAGDVLAPPTPVERLRPVTNLFPAPSHTYSVSFFSCDPVTRIPGRWETADMLVGIPFVKNSANNASGLMDGGVAMIQSGLATWNNDCESVVNLSYGGTTSALKDGNDEVNVVIFNDPGGHVAGTWPAGGLIAITFTAGNNIHSFDGVDWVSFSDSDIIFQNGYAGTELSIEEAMTHEIGHGIGFRHSNFHYLRTATDLDPGAPCVIQINAETTACDSANQECAAIGFSMMASTVTSDMGFNLQTYDQHAADALYPGTCVAVPPPTNVVATGTSASNVNITWTAAIGAASYNVYRSTNGSTYSLAGNTSMTSFNDGGRSANTAYLYRVRSVSTGESVDSNRDLATTVVFTDDPLVVFTTTVKAAHITQLRTAVDAIRTAMTPLGAGSYTDPTITPGTTLAKAVHINNLRTALDAARSHLGLTAVTYGETVTALTTTIKASHINELRGGVK